jgi:ribose 1,5-bisphosphokinase
MKTLLQDTCRLIVVVGASGAGKDSLLRHWLAALPPHQRPHLAKRAITRPAGDVHEAHEAVDVTRFHAERAAGAFAFDWQAHGLHYGIRWRELQPLAQDGWVVFNGSRQHLAELLVQAPRAHVVEVLASEATRRARLAGRAREAAAEGAARLQRSAPPVPAALSLVNEGELAHTAARLAAWWQLLADTPALG